MSYVDQWTPPKSKAIHADRTALPDLTGVTLHDLRRTDLADEVAVVLAQVERPRANLGGSGPPGRAD